MNTFISCVKYKTPSPFFFFLLPNCVFGDLIKFHSVSFIDFTGGHIYHSQCLNDWIVSKQDRNEVPNCPMCRAEITQEDCTKVKHTFSIITHRREADAKQRKREKEATERFRYVVIYATCFTLGRSECRKTLGSLSMAEV